MNIELKQVTSSNIESAGYCADTGTLVVEFKGGKRYKYPGVTPELWKEFEVTFDGSDGRSAGRFHRENFRDLPCERIEN